MSTSSGPLASLEPSTRGRGLATAYALAVVLAAGLVALAWYGLGRPLGVPDAALSGGRMQCVSYTPFLRHQSPLEPFVISREQVARDFALLSRYFRCVRTYSVAGLELIPEVAAEHGLAVLLGAWIGPDREARGGFVQQEDFRVQRQRAGTGGARGARQSVPGDRLGGGGRQRGVAAP